jgi:CheY-like chemotaxis protein
MITTERINATRVLVVDDEPAIVDVVATSLRYEGFTVDEATTGRLALALAQKDAHDLVILDVRLPDLDGIEVTRRLRTDGVLVLRQSAVRTSWRRSAASTLNTTFVTLPTSIRSHVFDFSYVRHAHSKRSSAVALREARRLWHGRRRLPRAWHHRSP